MEYQLSEKAYKAFSAFLHQKLGIVLSDKKQYLVRSRLSSVARDLDYQDLNVFLFDVVNAKNRELTDKCLDLMTTNETFWFRDGYPFSLLENHLLPLLSQQKNSLRIWSSACASGQEPYSIAMIILEYKRKQPRSFTGTVEVIGTDFSSRMIAKSREGIYDELALGRGLPKQICTRYFDKAPKNAMQIKKEVASIVDFKRLNLLQEFSSLGKFDCIFCRNVLIYFDGKQKQEILTKIAACLHPGGILFLGSAESIVGVENLFKMHSKDKGLYYSKL